MSNAKISFDPILGDIIAEWPHYTDKISYGIVYLTIAQAEQAKKWGWKIFGTQTTDESDKGLVKVERRVSRMSSRIDSISSRESDEKMKVIIGGMSMESIMSDMEVMEQINELLQHADDALVKEIYAEAHGYIKAARVLIEDMESHQQIHKRPVHRPRRNLAKKRKPAK